MGRPGSGSHHSAHVHWAHLRHRATRKGGREMQPRCPGWKRTLRRAVFQSLPQELNRKARLEGIYQRLRVATQPCAHVRGSLQGSLTFSRKTVQGQMHRKPAMQPLHREVLQVEGQSLGEVRGRLRSRVARGCAQGRGTERSSHSVRFESGGGQNRIMCRGRGKHRL